MGETIQYRAGQPERIALVMAPGFATVIQMFTTQSVDPEHRPAKRF